MKVRELLPVIKDTFRIYSYERDEDGEKIAMLVGSKYSDLNDICLLMDREIEAVLSDNADGIVIVLAEKEVRE